MTNDDLEDRSEWLANPHTQKYIRAVKNEMRTAEQALVGRIENGPHEDGIVSDMAYIGGQLRGLRIALMKAGVRHGE